MRLGIIKKKKEKRKKKHQFSPQTFTSSVTVEKNAHFLCTLHVFTEYFPGMKILRPGYDLVFFLIIDQTF